MTRLTCLLSVLLIATLALASSPAPPPTPIHDHLLPEAPTAVVTLRSVDDLHALWAEFAAMVGSEEEAAGLHAALTEGIPGFAEMTDFGLPLAMTFRMPPVMLQQEPLITVFLPLLPAITDVSEYVDMEDVAVVLIKDGYVALSADPAYEPAAEIPALAGGMLDGIVSASADLGGLISQNRAIIEMGLDSAPMAVAMADTSGEAEVTPEQVTAMVDAARLVLDSLNRVDLAFDMVSNDLIVRSHTAMAPGSPLDCGAQPDFAEALALTRLLPPGGLFMQTAAMDLSKLFEVFGGFYAQSMQDAMPGLTPEKQEAFEALWSDYMELVGSKMNIMASTARMDDGKFSGSTAVKVDGAKDLLDELARHADTFNALDLGFTYERLPDGEAGGQPVYGWTMDLEGMFRQSLAAKAGDEDLDLEETAKIMDVLGSMSSTIRLCARDDVLLFALDDDPDGIAEMVRTMARGDGRVDPHTAALAARAGPSCREVFYGDYSMLMNWVLVVMPQAQDMAVGPIEFEGFWTLDGPDSGMELVVDLDGVRVFLGFMQAMEDEECVELSGHEHGHGD